MVTRAQRHAIIIAGVGVLTVAAGMLAVAFSELSDDARPARRPATPPAGIPQQLTREGDWPAFHRGGRLLGQGDAIGPPPMSLRWTFKTEGGGFVRCSAAVVGRTVFVGDGEGTFRAVSLTDGSLRWRFQAGAALECTPLVVGGRVFFGDTQGLFYALSADTGNKLWSDDCRKEIVSSPNLFQRNIVFGNSDGWAFCYTQQGRRVWGVKLADRINGSPAVRDGTLWIGSCDHMLRAVSGADGSEQISIDAGEYLAAAPAATPDGLIIGGYNGKVFCYDPDTAVPLWTYDRIGREMLTYASAAWADGIAVVGARDHCVHAIDSRTGRPLWRFSTGGDVDGSPALAGGRVYVGSRDGRFYVLDLHDGRELWSYRAEARISFSPVVTAGLALVGDEDGNLYCFEPASPQTTGAEPPAGSPP
ncbi:MAG: Outer membrane protein assembly factor BamB [Phycisphaerae bacterium]|nr:Outer membrane protein assembly factor BamB [Phycisphaerae bacterium]